MKNKHNFTKALLATVMAIFSIAATATAQCVIPIAPGQSYNEDFESGEMECWTVETTGAATWAVMAGTGSNVVAFQNASADDEARLVSPTFDLSGSNSASLSFTYAMLALYPPYDELTVSYRTSPTDDWHELGSYSLSDWTNTYDSATGRILTMRCSRCPTCRPRSKFRFWVTAMVDTTFSSMILRLPPQVVVPVR